VDVFRVLVEQESRVGGRLMSRFDCQEHLKRLFAVQYRRESAAPPPNCRFLE
jgi:hypothetical protein